MELFYGSEIMVKLTKEDENKLGQILKELNEMKDVLKGGEGSGRRDIYQGMATVEARHKKEEEKMKRWKEKQNIK